MFDSSLNIQFFISLTLFFIGFQVRKTSIRMTAIKEYPFDLSDLQNQQNIGGDTKPAQGQLVPPPINQRISVPALDGKRKVSIMADESSKDRENLPSDRYVQFNDYIHCLTKQYSP